jgi:hypothetical protein
MLLTSAFAGLSSIRMIPFFVLVAVPFVSRSVRSGLGRQHSSSRQRPAVLAVLSALILLAMAGFVSLHLAQLIRGQPQAEAAHFPVGAVTYLAANRPKGPIFNYYGWGGYLIFKLYPVTRVFIDGRADLYGDHLMEQCTNSYYLMDGWRETLSEWRIQTVIVPADSPLATGLHRAPRWVQSYGDSKSVIFSR